MTPVIFFPFYFLLTPLRNLPFFPTLFWERGKFGFLGKE